MEDFFKTNPKMDEALLNKLKKKVTNEVFSQLRQQKLILPPINPKSTFGHVQNEFPQLENIRFLIK